jgi:uncharacterized LabA/DUF88 family protein
MVVEGYENMALDDDDVAIFVDYDNVYWTLMNLHSHDPNHADSDKNLFARLWERYGHDHVRTFRVYADFDKVRTQLTSLQKKRVQIRHVYSNGEDLPDQRKNASDIELSIDAIENTYKDPNVKCYVFVTADSDMIPVLSRLMYKGKRVELYYVPEAAPKHVDLTDFAHYSEDLLQFLNVEVKTYDIDDYVTRALLFIRDWHAKYDKTDKYLGSSWLRQQFTDNFAIPASIANALLERLKVQDLIEYSPKAKFDGQTKMSVSVTPSGAKVIEPIVSQAASDFVADRY